MNISPDIIRPFRRCLLAGLFAALLSWAPALTASPPPPEAEPEDPVKFLLLKERFETLVQRHSDPIILTCLAVETTAQAWTLAAARLTDDPTVKAQWQARAIRFEKSWSAGRDWDNRHRRALRIYYEALSEVARKMAGIRHDGRQNAELAIVLEETDQALAVLAKKRPPDGYLEKEALSYGLMTLAGLIIRSSDHSLGPPADLILEAVDGEVEDLQQRKGLHYRARLSFIYTAQIQGLTDLIFLLGQTSGPALSLQLAEIQAALGKDGADPRLPTTLSLFWTAQAQASLPLAYWLSSRPSLNKGRRP